MDKSGINGITAKTLDFPEWKHSILKFVARLLFLKGANYVILIHSFTETKDDNGRRNRTRPSKP
jgi:hypothetical protein